jgi:ferredoxin-nitrite reductase
MAVHLSMAAMLAERAGGVDRLELEGATVGEVLGNLTDRHPALASLVWTPAGGFSEQLVAFLNGVNVRDLKGIATSVRPGDELMLITAVEGG